MIEISKITGFIGATIRGVDLKAELTEDIKAMLRSALAQHHVLVLRDQHLTIEDQRRLTAGFGPIMTLPYVTPMPEKSDVIAVLKEAHESGTGVFGGDWHSDFSFLPNPPAGSVLNAVEIPKVGGDTVWASQVAAYATLPPHLQDLLKARAAIHVGKPYGVKYAPPEKDRANTSIHMTRGDPNADQETLHPAVIANPVTGKLALFLNPIYVTRFDGMTEEQSRPFLDQIYKHATRPDLSMRHKWQAGDVVVWDNHMTLHYATNDYDGARRLLYRTTFEGPAPAQSDGSATSRAP